MATKRDEYVVRTREEADKIAARKGQPGYSEVYLVAGPREVQLVDGSTGWEVILETYYG